MVVTRSARKACEPTVSLATAVSPATPTKKRNSKTLSETPTKSFSNVRIDDKGQKVEKQVDAQIVYEFGGSLGVSCMMILFPCLMYYFWACLEFYEGSLQIPSKELVGKIMHHAAPTLKAAQIYLGFCLFQAILSLIMPGVWMKVSVN